MPRFIMNFDRSEHPLDVVERSAHLQDWSFDRAELDEMSVKVAGQWCEYQIAFTWMADVEALHIACAFDLKVSDRKKHDILSLITLINEQLWLGHFDLWTHENVVMYRHALLLSGGAEPSTAQCEMLLKSAVDACERFYQAFQFVLWAGRTSREAFDSVRFETQGHA